MHSTLPRFRDFGETPSSLRQQNRAASWSGNCISARAFEGFRCKTTRLNSTNSRSGWTLRLKRGNGETLHGHLGDFVRQSLRRAQKRHVESFTLFPLPQFPRFYLWSALPSDSETLFHETSAETTRTRPPSSTCLPLTSPFLRLLTKLSRSRFTRFTIASLRKKLRTPSSQRRSSIHRTRSDGSASEPITWGSCWAVDGERLLSSWEVLPRDYSQCGALWACRSAVGSAWERAGMWRPACYLRGEREEKEGLLMVKDSQ